MSANVARQRARELRARAKGLDRIGLADVGTRIESSDLAPINEIQAAKVSQVKSVYSSRLEKSGEAKTVFKVHISEQNSSNGDGGFAAMHMTILVVIFAASGLVPLQEIAFVASITLYTFILSFILKRRLNGRIPISAKDYSPGKWHRFYNFTRTMLGLILPMIYALGGFTRSDLRAIMATTPHIFVMSCKFLSEILLCGPKQKVAEPAKVILSIMFDIRCLYTLVSWIGTFPSSTDACHSFWSWNDFGKAVAILNLAFWMASMFGYSIPFQLPDSFQIHTCDH